MSLILKNVINKNKKVHVTAKITNQNLRRPRHGMKRAQTEGEEKAEGCYGHRD